MKRSAAFLLGIVCFSAGAAAGAVFSALRNGAGSNSGSEFFGSEYTPMLKGSAAGLGNNAGSKFYSDLYIREKFAAERRGAEL